MKKLFTKLSLLWVLCLIGGNAWADSETIYKAMWTEDFEAPSQNLYGFTYDNTTAFAGQQALSNGTHCFQIYGGDVNGRNYTLSFTSNPYFTNYTDFAFEFDYAVTSGNTQATELKIEGSNGTLFTVSAGSSAETAAVAKGDATSVGTINATKYANPGTLGQNDLPTNFYHFIVTSNESGVKLKVTKADGTAVINTVSLANEFAKITSMKVFTGRYYAHQLIDNLSMSIPVKTVVTNVTSWNLKNISATTTWISLDASETFNINGTSMQKSTSSAATGLLFDSNGNVWRVGNFGLRQQSGNGSRNIGIPNLKKGDVVVVTGSWSGTEAAVVTGVSGNASMETSLDNKTNTITMTTDGDLSIGLRRITKTDTYTAESIQLTQQRITYNFLPGDDATVAVENADFTKGTDPWATDNEAGTRNFAIIDDQPTTSTKALESYVFIVNQSVATKGNNRLAYQTLTGLTSGYYMLTAKTFNTRAWFDDKSIEPNPIILYCGAGEELVNSPAFTENSVIGYTEDGTLEIGIKPDGSNFNTDWNAIADVQLTYVGKSSTINVPISPAAGYATFVTPYAMNFEGTGVTAYSVDVDAEHSKVVLTEQAQVPAGKAVVVKGTSDDVPIVASADDFDTDLQYSTKAIAFDEDPSVTYYVLALQDSKVVFAPVNAGEIAAGKGYFTIAKAKAAPAFYIDLGDETAIESIQAAKTAESHEVFNLSGQRVSNNFKGIVIKNGAKYLIK